MRTVDPAKHRARRQHILNAAIELFATRGYDGTSTAEICKAAGISSGNLFHYFASKREIFAAIFEEDGSSKTAALAAARERPDPWAALLEVVDLLAVAATEPFVPALVMEAMLRAYRDPELNAMLTRDAENERETVEVLVSRAIAAGRIDPGLPPSHIADWIMALVGTLYTTAATNPAFEPAEQLPNLRLLLERFLRVRPA